MAVESSKPRRASRAGAVAAVVIGALAVVILAALVLMAAPRPQGRPTRLAEIERAILRRLAPPNPIKPLRRVAPADQSRPPASDNPGS